MFSYIQVQFMLLNTSDFHISFVKTQRGRRKCLPCVALIIIYLFLLNPGRRSPILCEWTNMDILIGCKQGMVFCRNAGVNEIKKFLDSRCSKSTLITVECERNETFYFRTFRNDAVIDDWHLRQEAVGQQSQRLL